MSEKYGDVRDQLEPEAASESLRVGIYSLRSLSEQSIAISLKRIADYLEPAEKRALDK